MHSNSFDDIVLFGDTGWRKVTEEFVKRMDPELPLYYHTSSNAHSMKD